MSRDEIYKTVQTLIKEKDIFAAIEYLLELGDEAEIVEAFKNIVVDSHFKAKSTEQVLHFGNAGIHFCLTRAVALDGSDDEVARKLRFTAKALATDVASFTWPGWQEPGVAISPEQMAQGLAFARYSVRQLHELEPTATQLGFTYWFLGAQLIANGHNAEAIEVFEQARDYAAQQGDNPDAVTMNEGYIALAKILSDKTETGEVEFNTAIAELKTRESDDAKFYAEQLLSVRAFFEKSDVSTGHSTV